MRWTPKGKKENMEKGALQLSFRKGKKQKQSWRKEVSKLLQEVPKVKLCSLYHQPLGKCVLWRLHPWACAWMNLSAHYMGVAHLLQDITLKLTLLRSLQNTFWQGCSSRRSFVLLVFHFHLCFIPWFPFLCSEHEAGRDGIKEEVVVWSLTVTQIHCKLSVTVFCFQS